MYRTHLIVLLLIVATTLFKKDQGSDVVGSECNLAGSFSKYLYPHRFAAVTSYLQDGDHGLIVAASGGRGDLATGGESVGVFD